MTDQASSYQTPRYQGASIDDLAPAKPPRKRLSPTYRLTYVNFATLLTCFLFLYDGLEPGWSTFMCVSLLMFCALAIAWTVASFQWLMDGDRCSRRDMIVGVLRMSITPLLAVACGAMMILSVPARIGLWASLHELQPLLQNAPTAPHGKSLNRRVGVYDVLRYAADGNGGVYFVTGDYRDGLKKDRVSLGFAYHPSRTGTPFGRERYRLIHVTGDWYSFAATEPGK